MKIRLSVLCRPDTRWAGFLPYTAKIENCNLVLVSNFWLWFRWYQIFQNPRGCRNRNVAGAPETNWPAGAYVTRRGCFKDFNSAHFVYRFLIRRILFSSSRSAEMLFWEIYFIYTLGGKEISSILNIGQDFMKKMDFANTQPLY